MSDKRIRICMEFAVRDEEVLQHEFDQVDTLGYEPQTLADVACEAMFHSNPGVRGYLDYGVELIRTDTEVME
jgi:hypothetical protein